MNAAVEGSATQLAQAAEQGDIANRGRSGILCVRGDASRPRLPALALVGKPGSEWIFEFFEHNGCAEFRDAEEWVADDD